MGVLGCFPANWNTIERETVLPSTHKEKGKAVHLDIQQRLLIVNALGLYCSEPSPDALASFAAAIGIGADSPTKKTLSVIGSNQSAAASVGLRTQTITLMRDALFRMCEAYMNKALGGPQVAALLHRSQDLTAVILAVEQLTGTVIANQASLTGRATADISPNVLATAGLLEQTMVTEDRRERELEQANAELLSARTKLEAAQRALQVAQEDKARLPATATAHDSSEAASKVRSKQLEKERTDLEARNAKKRVDLQKERLDRIKRIREVIESKQDAAITELSTMVSGEAQFSAPVQTNQLSSAVSEQVARSVERMVNNVINKDYTIEYCMAVISTIDTDSASAAQSIILESIVHSDNTTTSVITFPERSELNDDLRKTKKLCLELMQVNVKERTKAITYGYDELSAAIDTWLNEEDDNRVKLRNWLGEKYPDLRLTDLLLDKNLKEVRKEVVDHFNLNSN